MSSRSRVSAAPLPAEALDGVFPAIDLPVRPPFPPMEATVAETLPGGAGWSFAPKWDGFRCLAFKQGPDVILQSKAGQPLGRYFPEVVAAITRMTPARGVLDGEIVMVKDGRLAFDTLLHRIHPADSLIWKLAPETPAIYVAFDFLVDGGGRSLVTEPLAARRRRLEAFFDTVDAADGRLSPHTLDRAQAGRWMRDLAAVGLDGVVAKREELPYRAGVRDGMVKVKCLRTADCLVAGFRHAQSGTAIGSLLLGLYNDQGQIDHVGFAASFTAPERAALKAVVEPMRGGSGFTGRAPGGPSRWSAGRNTEWVALHPTLVCKVRYDHYASGRFRHGTKFLRWRPDKAPEQCTLAQVEPAPQARLLRSLGL